MAAPSRDAVYAKIPMSEPPTDEQIAKCRKVVCANATDSAEAEEFMKMLGLL